MVLREASQSAVNRKRVALEMVSLLNDFNFKDIDYIDIRAAEYSRTV